MRISAFTIIKNATKFDYPITESIESIIDYVDEYIINIGSDDPDTLRAIDSLARRHTKIKYFVSDWEDSTKGTTFFSSQTNLALEKCAGDWCIYLQADEVIHEDDACKLRDWIDRAEAEGSNGVTFQYYHFEKDYTHLRKSYKNGGDAYDIELRAIRNDGSLISTGDAQSFSFLDQVVDPRGPQPALRRADRFVDSPLYVYHYGYVRDSKKMLDKKKSLQEFYNVTHPDRHEVIEGDAEGNYIYQKDLLDFTGTHPLVMKDRIERFNLNE